MSNSLYQFNTPQTENVVRAVDFVGALFDNFKAGTISEGVARKAAVEVILTGDCAPTARLWTMLIENHDRNDLEQMSLLEPGDGPLNVKILPEKPDQPQRIARAKRIPKKST
jgi:hypothetical protein